jgi:hypothetical protein
MALITYILMITVNILANALPINGLTTGDVSAELENLFTPAGLTFSIWGLIYTLLGLYILYQSGLFSKKIKPSNELLNSIGILFSVSSLANASWIIAWHYQQFALTLVIMFILLITLILIVLRIKKETITGREVLFIKIPFSIYFGWITIATIANITVFLVSLGFTGLGIPETIWAVMIISVGCVIALTTIFFNKDIYYGLVIIWAYAGILIKHTSDSGFDSVYPSVITTVIICLLVLLTGEVILFFKNSRHQKTSGI